jgi:serine/threonine-protein kinase SRPK3
MPFLTKGCRNVLRLTCIPQTRRIIRVTREVCTYAPPGDDDMEDLHLYTKGGLHPVMIGDLLNHGRYHVVHKLGAGRAITWEGTGRKSTVWLARDLAPTIGGISDSVDFPLVSIKIPEASDPSTISLNQLPEEIKVARALHASAMDRGHEHIRSHMLSIHSTFREVGPNGTHECLVSPVAGPNVYLMACHGQGRYRADLARKICRQVTKTLQHIHSCGYVHGGKASLIPLSR